MTKEQAVDLMKETRKQAKSQWFQYRASRITAPKFKVAVSTDPAQPSYAFAYKSYLLPRISKYSYVVNVKLFKSIVIDLNCISVGVVIIRSR